MGGKTPGTPRERRKARWLARRIARSEARSQRAARLASRTIGRAEKLCVNFRHFVSAQDELAAAACLAIRRLTPIKKAGLLLNTLLSLIEDGQYGKEVENYLDIYLKTPGLPKEDMEKALLARSSPWKLDGGQLQLRPRSELPCKEIHFSIDPAWQRTPPEIWAQIAAQTPRYHLRTWLSVSPLHRDIASHQIFHTVDIYFLESESLNRGLDLLEHAINTPIFASRVKSLRLHWDYEEEDVMDLILRMLKIALPAFKALCDFEWIGRPEMPVEIADVLLSTHKRLHGLGLRGETFDAVEASAFHDLRKFTFRMKDEDLKDIRIVLDGNENTLKNLILGGCEDLDDSLDLAFESATINNLTHLDLFGMHVSCFVLDRIAHAHNLQSLTLHGSFLALDASQMFATDQIIDGTHTCLPHLESFGFVMEDGDEDLYHSVIHFLRKREKLRRLDLGSCSWDTIQDILPDLENLRVLAVCIDELSQEKMKSIVEALPTQMVAIRLSVCVSDKPLDEYFHCFIRFNTLSFLSLSFLHHKLPTHPAEPDPMSSFDFQMQTLCNIVPSLDFLVVDDIHYVVVRFDGDMGLTVELKELPTGSDLKYGSGVDVVSEDIAWLRQ